MMYSHFLYPLETTKTSSQRLAHQETNIIIKRRSSIKLIRASVTRNIRVEIVVAEEASRITPGANRVPLSIQPRLGTERRVLSELLGGVICINMKLKVVVPDE